VQGSVCSEESLEPKKEKLSLSRIEVLFEEHTEPCQHQHLSKIFINEHDIIALKSE
jgi:hypothetical protein